MIYLEEGKVKYSGTIQEFVSQNNKNTRYVIEYSGHINKEVLELIASKADDLIEKKPLKINMSTQSKISEIISILENKVNITNITNENLSLREAYLELKLEKGD